MAEEREKCYHNIMSSKIFIYTLIIAAVVIGGSILLDRFPPPENPVGLVISSDGKISGEYSLKDIIALDEPFKCEFEKKEGDSRVKGTISIAPGAKVRGDFIISSNAVSLPFESHFIMRGGYIYTWTSLLNAGFIAPASAGLSSQAGLVAVDKKIKYDCSRFQLKQGIFEVPADITFTNAKR